jgi:membrane peptidoglycan carboxypeptidase
MGDTRTGGGIGAVGRAGTFLGVSVLAGVVLAGIALPAVGAVGLSAKGTANEFDSLPGALSTPPLSQRTQILDSQGGLIASVYSRDRKVLKSLNDISPTMQKAIVAIEDSRYWKHGAIDVKGILRALNKNAESGGVSQGASTLAQQYVKNVSVEEAGDDATKVAQATQQTLGRKIKEMKYAIQIEDKLGKKRILLNYLNIVPFGEQSYGIEAAAARYFSTDARGLTLPQSALLAGLVQAPSVYDPVNNPEAATKRRNTVLQRMADLGDITQAQADAAGKQPLGLSLTKPKNGCITAVSGAGFFCDYVREVFLNDATFGRTAALRAKRWNLGGLTIRTTLDPQAQSAAQKSIRDHVYQSDKVATAVTLVQPGTGKILGMGQSRPYGFGTNQTQINLSVDRDRGGSRYGFQTGSTFKPITAAAALDQGMDPTKQYPAPYEMEYPSPVATCNGAWTNREGAKVSNENKSEVGPYRMKEATAKSVNTYFVQMISDIGVCPVVTMAGSMGVEPAAGGKLSQVPSITLGTMGMSPLTMANAYATFANDGVYCTPVAIESVTDTNGKKLNVPQTTCKRAMSEKTADTINTLLRGVVEDGTGQQAGLRNRDSAGKTGTTDSRYAAWFVGYTKQLAGAVWVGGPTGNVSMTKITIGGVYHAKVFGADTPGPIWKDAMSGALEGQPNETLPTVPIADPDANKGKKDKDNGNSDRNPFPLPHFSLPPGMIGGNGPSGGNRGGRGFSSGGLR